MYVYIYIERERDRERFVITYTILLLVLDSDKRFSLRCYWVENGLLIGGLAAVVAAARQKKPEEPAPTIQDSAPTRQREIEDTGSQEAGPVDIFREPSQRMLSTTSM